MKKISFAIIIFVLCISLNTFATLNSLDKKFNLSNHASSGDFIFGMTGLNLSSSPNLDLSFNSPANSQKTESDYNWGFKVNMGYAFPDSSKDIMLTYSHNNQIDKIQ